MSGSEQLRTERQRRALRRECRLLDQSHDRFMKQLLDIDRATCKDWEYLATLAGIDPDDFRSLTEKMLKHTDPPFHRPTACQIAFDELREELEDGADFVPLEEPPA